jgi:lipid A 3-O-deacylase
VGRATEEIGRGWLRGRFEYGVDFIPIFVQFTPERIFGTAFDPIILRWNSTRHRGPVSPFVELAGGGVHTGVNFPAGDSSTFNFIARGGGGVLIAIRQNQALELACRWWHISNANLGSRNPEFNGVQVSLGWHWFK